MPEGLSYSREEQSQILRGLPAVGRLKHDLYCRLLMSDLSVRTLICHTDSKWGWQRNRESTPKRCGESVGVQAFVEKKDGAV